MRHVFLHTHKPGEIDLQGLLEVLQRLLELAPVAVHLSDVVVRRRDARVVLADKLKLGKHFVP